MNTRGLTEIIVLQIAYDARILTTPIYVAFLVMALVTTALTSPLLRLVDKAAPPSHGAAHLLSATTSRVTLASGGVAVPLEESS
jgi:Kef-type K+ transport system membrane component KefB